MVHGVDRHCSQCPVLFQLILAQVWRQADSVTPAVQLPATWPVPQPQLQNSIAQCLVSPDTSSDYPLLKQMAIVAKSHCLQCGELMQDMQAWRRHAKANHKEQNKLLDAIGTSVTLMSAHFSRPCPWCDVHFQKSAKEHRKKCLPLLQLSLRHDWTASAAGARTAVGSGLGSQLPSGGDANTTAPGECNPITTEPGTAKQVQEGAGQGQADSEQEGKRARRRGGRRRDVARPRG